MILEILVMTAFLTRLPKETYLSPRENRYLHTYLFQHSTLAPFFFSFECVGRWAVEVGNKGMYVFHDKYKNL